MPRQPGGQLLDIQRRFNALVPQARRLGVPRVRAWRTIPPSIREGEDRLNAVIAAIIARGEQPSYAPLTAPITDTAIIALEPELASFTFGIEIECYMPSGMTRDVLARRISDAGIRCVAEQYYTAHTHRSYWKIVQDGSLGDRSRGAEIVSPVLSGPDGLKALRQVCKLLDANGCSVERPAHVRSSSYADLRPGFHVHIGARGRDLGWFKRLLRMYAYYEDTIDTLTAATRRGNANRWARSTKLLVDDPQRAAAMERATTLNQLAVAYCAMLGTSRFWSNGRVRPEVDNWTDAQMSSLLDHARYQKVNMHAYYRHGTVEFRQHQGTISADKAEHWVRLILRLAAVAARDNSLDGPVSLQSFAQKLNMPAVELAYFERRVAELARRRRTPASATA